MIGLLLFSDIGCPLKLVEKLGPGITLMGRGGGGSDVPLVPAALVAPSELVAPDELVLPAAPGIPAAPVRVVPPPDGRVPPSLLLDFVPPLEVVPLLVALAPPVALRAVLAVAPPVPEPVAIESSGVAPPLEAHAAHTNRATPNDE
jgi:hypothetical protein